MQSMDEIYQKYARTVYKYLLSRTQNEALAEELTQETFYQAIQSIDRFEGKCKLSTWLCAIAKHQLLSYQRKHPPQDNLEETSSSVESAEDKVLGSMNYVELMKRLHLCPEPFREILYMRIFGNLSFKEIGEIMGQTENWARVTYYRGKEKLKKGLSEDEK
ncbi:MAG: sigma-70 family RNA polymerase sigma factor [Dorea sp.]|nr:sigma-70 family RNA polymerase sigma factor [Dorea sp.]